MYIYPNLYTPVCVCLYMKAVSVYNLSEMELALSSGHEKEKTK